MERPSIEASGRWLTGGLAVVSEASPAVELTLRVALLHEDAWRGRPVGIAPALMDLFVSPSVRPRHVEERPTSITGPE